MFRIFSVYSCTNQVILSTTSKVSLVTCNRFLKNSYTKQLFVILLSRERHNRYRCTLSPTFAVFYLLFMDINLQDRTDVVTFQLLQRESTISETMKQKQEKKRVLEIFLLLSRETINIFSIRRFVKFKSCNIRNYRFIT